MIGPSGKRQQGVALLIVLLIVAIVSLLATEMGSRLQLQVKRASNIKENNQAYWYAMGAEQYARKSIKLLMDNSPDEINLSQAWSQEFAFPIDGGGIQASLVDMQACFNLNALTSATESTTQSNNNTPSPEELAFRQLLNLLDVPSFDAETSSESLADWLDSDTSMRSLGAEDSEYESRQFPYLAANSLMAHKSEIRVVNGISHEWLDKLLPHICVIPNNQEMKINVNTLTEDNAVILAALTGLELSVAQSIISSRGEKGFSKAADFLQSKEVAALSLSDKKKAWFDVTTSYFLLKTKAAYNDASFSMTTVFFVDKNSNNAVKVLRREFGGF